MEKMELKSHKPKPPRMTSIEETVQLARIQQASVTTSAIYDRKPNQKALKVLTVAAYILFVSMAAITLSFYYVFIWDPSSTKPPPAKAAVICDTKIIIPENMAVRLANSTQVTAEKFYKYIYQNYQQQSNDGDIIDTEPDPNPTLNPFLQRGSAVNARRIMVEPLPLARLTASNPPYTPSASAAGQEDDDDDAMLVVGPSVVPPEAADEAEMNAAGTSSTTPTADLTSSPPTNRPPQFDSEQILAEALIDQAYADGRGVRNNKKPSVRKHLSHRPRNKLRVDVDAEETAEEDDDDDDDDDGDFEASGAPRVNDATANRPETGQDEATDHDNDNGDDGDDVVAANNGV